MNLRDIKVGDVVYHSLYTHWGKGIVEKITMVNTMEKLFEFGTHRVIVRFAEHQTSSRVSLNEIRKTPNKKKIREMVEFYQKRGVDAQDGGDRLILP